MEGWAEEDMEDRTNGIEGQEAKKKMNSGRMGERGIWKNRGMELRRKRWMEDGRMEGMVG
jgi:hypothetical protein